MALSDSTAATDSDSSVLFVSPEPDIAEPHSGEGARLHHLSRGLSESWSVYTLVPESTATGTPEWVTRQYTYDQWSMPFLTDLNPSFVRSLRRVLRRESIDVIHTSVGVCAAQMLAGEGTTVSYAAQNVEAEHARDFVNPELPVYKRLLGPRLIPWLERATVACADLVTTVSEKDRQSFIDRYGVESERIAAIPTGTQSVDRSELEPRDAVRARFGLESNIPVAVFHGSYAHPPNEEAFQLIVEDIAPELRRRGSDVQFLLAGKGVPEMGGENVVVAGFVEDLFSVLNAADFAVVPIRHGGGTKTKMYDYISLGLPIVTTEKGAEGVDLKDGVHAIVTDGVGEEFTAALSELAGSEARRTELRANLVDLSEALNWFRSVDRFARFY